VLICAACALLPLALVGCGGGGGGGGGGGNTTTPVPPTPPPPKEIDVSILSYNLEWWARHKNNDYSTIADTINAVGPFDLMGFQESEDASKFLDDVTKHSSINYAFKQGGDNIPPKSEGWGTSGDISIAWNTKKFKKVSEGDAVAGKDGWGNRYMHWVRLNIIGSDKHIVMSNTHGPVGQCRGPEDWKNVAHNYISNTKGAMKPGDHMFMTGDFNCGATPSSKHDPHGAGLDDIIVEMRKDWKDIGQASFFRNALYQPDRIWVMKDSDVKVKGWTAQCCAPPGSCKVVTMKKDDPDDPSAQSCTATPSDHMLLEARTTVPLASSRRDEVQFTV